jgi:TolB protein
MVQRTAALRTFGYVHAANTFYVIDADGTNEARRIHAPESAAEAALSPDGEKIAIVSGDFADTTTGVIDVYVTDADGTDEIPITGTHSKQEDPDLDVVRTVRGSPVWSSDGKRIAFTSYSLTNGESAGLYMINAGGTGMRRLANSIVPEAFPAWSPDRKKIAIFCPPAPAAAGADLCMINADGTKWRRLSLDVDQH